MIGLQPSLYSIALALCVFCTGLLSQRRTRAGRPLRFFSAYLGLEAGGFALELLAAHPATPYKSLWLALLLATSLLTAPLLWLALREIVTGASPRLRELAWPHFAVIGFGALCTLPLMASAHGSSTWVNPQAPAVQPWHYYTIHETMLICIGLFAVQAPFYLQRTRRLLRTHAPDAGRAWLHLPLVIVGTTWAMGLLRTAQCATGAPAEWNGLFACIDVSVTVGALYLIVRREFESELVEPEPSPAEKYAKSTLDPAHCARVRQKLTRAFTEQQIHHDSLISLASLSRAIAEKPHSVSQAINQALGTTFYDLVNQHRIADARRLLRDQPDQTVLEIALAVGFNAKSTFNTAFKRHTGQTPREFRAETSGQIG